MLAMKQSLLPTPAIAAAAAASSAAADADASASGSAPRADGRSTDRAPAPADSDDRQWGLFAVLGADMVSMVIARTGCVRAILRFAEACSDAHVLVHAVHPPWRAIYAPILPARVAHSASPEMLTDVLTAVELVLEGPQLFVPSAEEAGALRWFAGDRSRLSPSNLFLMHVDRSPDLAAMHEELAAMRGENRSSISDVLQSHTQAVRAAFRAEHFEASSAQAQVGLRSVLSSAALTHTLLAVRGIGNVLNRSTTQAYTLRSLLLLRGVPCSGAHTGTALHYLAAMLLRRAPHTARVVDLAGVVEAGVSALTRLELGLPRFHSLWSLARGPGHSGGAGAASSGSAGAWRLQQLLADLQPLRTSLDALLPLCHTCNTYFGAGGYSVHTRAPAGRGVARPGPVTEGMLYVGRVHGVACCAHCSRLFAARLCRDCVVLIQAAANWTRSAAVGPPCTHSGSFWRTWRARSRASAPTCSP